MTRYSPRREQVLSFISEFIEHNGYSPTVREIMKGCIISSPAVVQNHLNTLEKQGRLRRDPEISRSIRLAANRGSARAEADFLKVPVLGAIAAGQPIPVPESDHWVMAPEDTVSLPADLLGNKEEVFALQVKGTSMIDALIADGDIVILEPAQTANDGETVAVWLKDEGEVTLKKIHFERDYIRLQPANPLMEPIITPIENVQIQGRMLAVIRKAR